MKTIFAPKAVIEKWLSALRGDEYEQGRTCLHDVESNAYCCLGVLEHCLDGAVEDRYTPSLEWLDRHNILFHTEEGDKCVSPYLPKFMTSAWHANDYMHLGFLKIAGAIEACAEYTDNEQA